MLTIAVSALTSVGCGQRANERWQELRAEIRLGPSNDAVFALVKAALVKNQLGWKSDHQIFLLDFTVDATSVVRASSYTKPMGTDVRARDVRIFPIRMIVRYDDRNFPKHQPQLAIIEAFFYFDMFGEWKLVTADWSFPEKPIPVATEPASKE